MSIEERVERIKENVLKISQKYELDLKIVNITNCWS